MPGSVPLATQARKAWQYRLQLSPARLLASRLADVPSPADLSVPPSAELSVPSPEDKHVPCPEELPVPSPAELPVIVPTVPSLQLHL